ncbi:hypothetical protein P167DRAFT_269762 [Morchella conica CCBAS932]|uniref:Uncharacterized protein n=1 Tax=Morchella conica CCBAS932 TaxID=1392247 RepID=A0A3N4KI58_9PEZI|nr:hypothetical protein P167DRAFT_269762 [Morchella conica CCBAS932]
MKRARGNGITMGLGLGLGICFSYWQYALLMHFWQGLLFSYLFPSFFYNSFFLQLGIGTVFERLLSFLFPTLYFYYFLSINPPPPPLHLFYIAAIWPTPLHLRFRPWSSKPGRGSPPSTVDDEI